MSLRISGKNIEISDAYRTHVEGRVGSTLAKYFDGGFSGRVVIEPDGAGYRVDCKLHLDSGVDLHSEGRGHEIYPTFDQAAERLDKQLRRYKRRLKDHHHEARNSSLLDGEASHVVLAATPDADDEISADYAPMVIAEESTRLRTLSVSGAVMAMDLANTPVIVFRHAGHGGVNIVYRREDGNIGWIDPAPAGKGDSVDR